MQGIRIGPAALLSIPGEPYTELNKRILEGSPFKVTMFYGYSNGGFGYLPTREAYMDGGYEVDASPFSPDAADSVVQEGIKMLKELA
jgi:neutral ceramidase